MWKFRTKQLDRHSKIFREVYILENQLNERELSGILDCDIKTVHATIENMNVIYDIPFLYFDEKTSLLTSNYQRGTSNLHTFSSFFNNNTEFILLEYIFLNGPVTTREISDDLFISESTLNRYISHLKMNLKNYGITISNNDLYFEGDEIEVRNFFLHYFLEKNDSRVLAKYPHFQKTCFSLFQQITDRDIFSEYKPLFNYFQWNTFVTFIRLSKGSKVTKTEVIPDIVFENVEQSFTDSIKGNLRQIFHLIDIENSIIEDYTFFLLPSNHMSDEFIKQSIESIEKQYRKFLDHFDIKLSDYLIKKNSNIFFQFFIGYREKRFFLFNTEEYKYYLMLNNYPKSMEAVYKIVEETLNNLGIYSQSAIYHFIFQTINYTPNVLEAYIEYEDKIDVKLFFVTESSKIDFVLKLLDVRFHNIARFEVVDSNKLLTEEDLGDDIWITNISNVIDEHILHITIELIYSEIPTIEDFLKSYKNRTLSTLR